MNHQSKPITWFLHDLFYIFSDVWYLDLEFHLSYYVICYNQIKKYKNEFIQ